MKRREFIKNVCSVAVAVMLTGCVSCGVANQQTKEKCEENMFVVRIAEIEVHPEWLEAYLASDKAGFITGENICIDMHLRRSRQVPRRATRGALQSKVARGCEG